jgi:hypothetical protein
MIIVPIIYHQSSRYQKALKDAEYSVNSLPDGFLLIIIFMDALWTWLKGSYLSSPTTYTVAAYLAYYAYICLASILLPAKQTLGHPQPKRGAQLSYSICGFRLTVLTILIVILFGGIFPSLKSLELFQIAGLVKNFWPLWSTVNLVAIAVAALLYIKGRFGIKVLKEEVDLHSHGSLGLDFWVGRELNPRIGSFDIKFIAYRVAMIFWLVLNFSFLALQAERHGEITLRMWLYQAFTGIYVLDYFWNE